MPTSRSSNIFSIPSRLPLSEGTAVFILALAAAVLIVFLAQRYIYKHHAFDGVTYRMTLDRTEVFEDDEIYVYEELGNNKILPLPYLKADSELPDGLTFHIAESDIKGGLRDLFPRQINSIFVLKGREMIRRRWRVRCVRRGTYVLGKATVITDDILGTKIQSKFFVPVPDGKNTLTVLPKAIDLEKEFTTSKYTNGEFTVQNSLLTDPLMKAGVREYVSGDSMNRINWKQTAVHNALLVNLEEYTQKQQFNIIMNMQTRDRDEKVSGEGRAPVELAITVAASILDRVSQDNIPVRLICNTDPPEDRMSAACCEDDGFGEKIFVSEPYKGRGEMLDALRMLAAMEISVSVPVEKMLDHIMEHPYAYTSGGNIVFVSAYLSERMINFCYNLRSMGIHMIFYITSANGANASVIPDDIEVHFKTSATRKEPTWSKN